jgi:hypothetical protein
MTVVNGDLSVRCEEMRPLTLAAVGFEPCGKTTWRAAFLTEMERVVPWSALSVLIAGNGSGTPCLVRHRLAAEVDPDKLPHRQRILKGLFHRRVRRIEPLLHEIDAQHPLDPDRRAAIARLRVKRLDRGARSGPAVV